MFILFFALGAICLIYYIALVSYSGTATPFSEAWIMATVVCLLLGLCFVIPRTKKLINKIPKVVKICVLSIVGAGALLFLVLLINVITGFNDNPQEKVDVVVVLDLHDLVPLPEQTVAGFSLFFPLLRRIQILL